MAQGVTRTINVNEIAAADLDVVSQTLCSSMICWMWKLKSIQNMLTFFNEYIVNVFICHLRQEFVGEI